MDGDTVPAPTSLAEVENLVKRLYLPGPPRIISQIDSHLKRIQISDDGWNLADGLLANQDENCRFFGALTFQVKLNNHGSQLDEESTQTVLVKLIHWAVQTDRAGESSLVRRKLCSSLATYFVLSRTLWRRPLLHLTTSFQQGLAVHPNQLPSDIFTIADILPALTESQLTTVLWMSGSLATETAKASNIPPAYYGELESAAKDTSTIIQYALTGAASSSQTKDAALATFLTWVEYSDKARHTAIRTSLGPVVADLLSLLTDAALRSGALSIFGDILESYTSFFTSAQMDIFANVIQDDLGPRMLQCIRDSDPEAQPALQVICGYGIANIKAIVEQPADVLRSGNIVHLCLAILQAPGYPGDDDELSIQCIDFWNTYVEHVTVVLGNQSHDSAAPPWLDNAKTVGMALSSQLVPKMTMPPPDVVKDWGDDESKAFKEFRNDASELMLACYFLLGEKLIQHLVSHVVTSLQQRNWQGVEVALYCLNVFADSVQEDDQVEHSLSSLFESSLYRDIADFSIPIPLQTRKTAVDTLGMYGQYIEKNVAYLPDSLRFLFACLDQPNLSPTAALSIGSLCAACRQYLTAELHGFLQQYQRLILSSASDLYINAKVIGAIAAIVQAVRPDNVKAQYISTMLDFVEGQVEQARQLAQSSNFDEAHTAGESVLVTLASIGRNLQVPEDVPISLDEDDQEEVSNDLSNYWKSQEGRALQDRILNACFTMLQLFPQSGEVVSNVCEVFKSGFVEVDPGPFVFLPATFASFVEQCSVSTPNLEMVLSVSCSLIAQYSRQDSRRTIHTEVHHIYLKIIEFIQALGNPNADETITMNIIDVLLKMVPRYLHILLDTSADGQRAKVVLDFVAETLSLPEFLSKRRAADFWAATIVATPQDAEVRDRLQQVIHVYGSVIIEKIVDQITGNGLRSELPSLTEVLRNLLTTRAESRAWMEAALQARTDLNVTDQDKKRFVQSLFAARRDNRKFKELVVKFYAGCRGTVVSYSTSS